MPNKQQISHIDKQKTSRYQFIRNALAASIASLAEQILYPLEVIEARLQSHDGQLKHNVVPKYKGIANASVQIATMEGVKGFYRGISVSFLTTNLGKSIFFGLYGYQKNMFEKKYGTQTHLPVILASTLSSLCTTLLTNPMWVTRTCLLLSTANPSLKIIIKSVYGEHGVLGFYRGLGISMLLSVQSGFQLAIYEYLNGINNKETHGLNHVMTPAYNSMISKMLVSMFLYPLTVVRTRVQQPQKIQDMKRKYKGGWDCITKTYKHEGLRGFYKGYLPNTMRSLPSNALFYCTFEFCRENLPF